MKRFLILICMVGGLAVVAWGVGAMLTRAAAIRWSEERRAEGWVSNLGSVSVGGFPTSFVTAFRAVEFADPATGLAWTTDLFTLEQQVFRLDRLSANFPSSQILASPEERLEIAHADLHAELDVQPANQFALDALGAEVADLTVTSSAGWVMAMDGAEVSATRVWEATQIYDANLTAHGMVPPEAWRDRLDPAGLLPQAIDRVVMDTRITFDAPWDMTAIEVARPQIAQIVIDDLNAAWGDMLFRATGTLEVSEGGVPEGELAVRAENWRAMVDLAANAGLVPERLRPTAEAMLGVLAGMNGREEDIDATLSFSNGRVFLGPLPIGPAPSLRLR